MIFLLRGFACEMRRCRSNSPLIEPKEEEEEEGGLYPRESREGAALFYGAGCWCCCYRSTIPVNINYPAGRKEDANYRGVRRSSRVQHPL